MLQPSEARLANILHPSQANDQNPELTMDAKAAVGEALGNLELLL